MSSKNYGYVGAVTLLLFIGIISMIIWKNSLFTRVKSYELVGEFQTINGLLENAVVKYRGYTVGRVTKIIPSQKTIEVFFSLIMNIRCPLDQK